MHSVVVFLLISNRTVRILWRRIVCPHFRSPSAVFSRIVQTIFLTTLHHLQFLIIRRWVNISFQFPIPFTPPATEFIDLWDGSPSNATGTVTEMNFKERVIFDYRIQYYQWVMCRRWLRKTRAMKLRFSQVLTSSLYKFEL